MNKSLITHHVMILFQGAIMAAVASPKWTSFYNDPSPPDDDDVTSAGECCRCILLVR